MADDDGLDGLADRALALRKGGAAWDTIADKVNMPATLVAAMVADRLLDNPDVEYEIEIRLDLARLDALLVPAYRAGTKGDPKAIDQALKILARRGELLSELDVADPSGARMDHVEGDTDPDDAPPVTLTPAETLARIRDQAVAGAGSSAVLRLVEDDPEADDDDD